MDSQDSNEISRLWNRQRLLILERCPAMYQEIRSSIEEGRPSVVILNLIDAALDREPSAATIVSAATQGFDHLRAQATAEEREGFLTLLSAVNGRATAPVELKRRLFVLAERHHASALLEGTYFDDVREYVDAE